MKHILVFVLLVAAALACLPFIPLKTALAVAHLDTFGFASSDIRGNVWAGHIYDARFGRIELGDVRSELSLSDLGKGRIKLALEGSDEVSRLKGALSYGVGGLGLEGFNIGVPAMFGAPPLGGLTINIADLNVRFPGGSCTDGAGVASAFIAGASPGLGIPRSISGPVICRDGHLVLDLMSDSGHEHQVITLLDFDRYRVRMTVRQSLPQITRALEANGFTAQPEGYVYETERQL